MTLPVYLILAFLLLVAAFVIFRIFVRRDYRRLGRLTLFSALLETFIFLCPGLVTLTYLPSDWPALRVSRLHAGMGAVPVMLGLAVVIAGMTNVGLRNTFGQPEGLKQTGVYALTRNPQIVGYGLFVIGIAILYWLGVILLVGPPLVMYVIRFPAEMQGASPKVLIYSALFALVNGTLEEVLWRGAYTTAFPDNWLWAILYPSIWFGLWHLSPQAVYPSQMSGGAIAFALMSIPLGLTWGWVAWTTGSIRWTVVAHILLNFAGLAGRSFIPPKANLAKVTKSF